MDTNDNNPAFLVDGITTIAVHNDVARIQFMQLDNEGKPRDAVRLLVPLRQAQQIHEALGQLAGSRQPSPKPERPDANQARSPAPRR
jgi:hypothetical protein